MIILVLNCGSSSLKYSLYDWSRQENICKGNVERIGQSGGIESHYKAIKEIFFLLIKKNMINDLGKIDAVGHRVVHGGDKFNKSVLIDDEVLRSISEVSVLAPLHNPKNIVGIETVRELLPNTPQVAVFDTAFHYTIPEKAYIYPVPYEWYQKYGVRKYGFHGSSHLYVSKVAAKMLGKDVKECSLISLHIGNGVSFTAIKNGISVDTSMGFTPLEGAVMGTRSGSIDPSIVDFMANKLESDSTKIISILNKESGIFGLSGGLKDHRDLKEAIRSGDERAKLTFDLEVYLIKKYIGSYLAAIGSVDSLIFTAGVGENDAAIRASACDGLENFGVELDYDINLKVSSVSGNSIISKKESKIKVLMIPTNEEAVCVEDVVAILEKRYDSHMKYNYSFA